MVSKNVLDWSRSDPPGNTHSHDKHGKSPSTFFSSKSSQNKLYFTDAQVIRMPAYSSFHRILNTFFRFDHHENFHIYYVLNLIFEHKSSEIANNKDFGEGISDELYNRTERNDQRENRIRALTTFPVKFEKEEEAKTEEEEVYAEMNEDAKSESQIRELNEFALPNRLLFQQTESISRLISSTEDKFGVYTPIDFSQLFPFSLFTGDGKPLTKTVNIFQK